ncbi:MAG: metalloregulator ArsR/SmtB family transcription factor [Pirellulaceae bacterium]
MIKKEESGMDMAALNLAADCLKTLANPSRLHIVQVLLSGKRYSVNELAELCGLSQPVTSDHLRLMQRCGYLDHEREGRTVYYYIVEPHLQGIMRCIQARFGKTDSTC